MMIWVLVSVISCVQSSVLDTKAVYLKEPGILIEPKNLILHHDDVFHTTVAIKIDSILPESNTELFSNCKQHIAREELKKEFTSRTEKIIRSLPKTASYGSGFSTCSDKRKDCSRNISQNERSLREKRFAGIPIAATIFGVVSLGMGLYTYLSQKSINEHLDNVENHIGSDDKIISSNAEYTQISASMYAKNFARSKVFESSLQNTLCSLEKGQNDNHLSLAVTEYLDYLVYNIQHSVEGHVTEFLVSRDLLNSSLLNQTSQDNSIYHTDPGLFYSASTSFLTRVNEKARILYFLVVTPRAFPKDLTTIYSVTNFGWNEGDYRVHYEVPDSFYYVFWDNTSYAVENKKEDCLVRSGLLICHSQTSTSSPKARCVQQLMNKSTLTECRVQREYSHHRDCTVRHTLSGILIRDCNSITLSKMVRGVIVDEDVKVTERSSIFLPYSTFQTAIIEKRSYTSRDTLYYSEIRKITPSSEIALPELPSLYSPAELSELMSFVHKKKQEEAERSTHELVSHGLVSHLIWFLAALLFILLCMGFMFWKIFYLSRTDSMYTHMLREVSTPEPAQIRMRTRRGRNTDS